MEKLTIKQPAEIPNDRNNCFEEGFYFVLLARLKMRKRFLLVHGICETDKGEPCGHCWAEHLNIDAIVDPSNGNGRVMIKHKNLTVYDSTGYYNRVKPRKEEGMVKKYTLKEAIFKIIRHWHYGPWDLNVELDTKVSNNPPQDEIETLENIPYWARKDPILQNAIRIVKDRFNSPQNDPNSIGSCYQIHAEFLLDNISNAKNLTLIQGSIKGKGDQEGQKIGHSWLEYKIMDQVIAIDLDRPGILPTQSLDSFGEILNRTEYTAKEVQSNIKAFDHYGPWTKDGVTGSITTRDGKSEIITY